MKKAQLRARFLQWNRLTLRVRVFVLLFYCVQHIMMHPRLFIRVCGVHVKRLNFPLLRSVGRLSASARRRSGSRGYRKLWSITSETLLTATAEGSRL